MEAGVLEGAEEGVEGVQEKVNRPGTFVKDDPRLSKNMAKAPVPPRVEVEAASNPLLTAYRFVLANPDKRVDRPGLEVVARESLKSHRKEFLARFSDLEDAEAERKREEQRALAANGEAAADQIDVGEAAAEALLVRLIAEWEEHHGKAD